MIVVDASYVVDLLVRPSTVPARAVDELWLAPSVLDTEVISGLRRQLLSGRLTPVEAAQALDDYAALGVITRHVDAPLRRRVLALSRNLTAYDATYLALAEALDAPLVTRDGPSAAGAPSPR